MEGSFTRLMYVSRASWLMSHGELEDLLAGARFRNKRHGITGVLLYELGHFSQVLEGPTNAIERLVKNISSDSRHKDFQVISTSSVEERYFSNWDMDWRELSEFSDSQHTSLRKLLQQHPIGDRAVIYRALSAFLTDLATDSDPAAADRKSWFW